MATCALVDIRHPKDLSLLNEVREINEVLTDTMYPHFRESFAHKPRKYRKQARQQFLAVAKKKKSLINKIRKAVKQQLGHFKLNLASIDGLIACRGCLLATGRHIYQKLLVSSELVRQQTILYHEDRTMADRIVSLGHAI